MQSLRVSVVVAALVAATGSVRADRRFSPWSTPVALDQVNTPALEFANGISKDGLSFYFQRGDAAVRGEDIWVVHREHEHAPWGAPEKLPPTVNTDDANDRAAFVSADGHWLYFASDRPGGRGGFDLMVSWRFHTGDDLGWETPQNLDDLGAPVNTPGFDSGPALLEGGGGEGEGEGGQTWLYLVSNPSGPQNNSVDIYVSLRNRDGSFDPPAKVAELSDPAFNEGRPYLRRDGKEIFFNANRPGSLLTDIWTSTRKRVRDPWEPPRRVEGVNSPTADNTPVLSWDGRTLFFASGRSGTGGEIYSSTRHEGSDDQDH